MTQAVGPASRSTDHRGQTGISGTGKRIANAMYPGVPSRLLTPALSSYQVSTGQTAPALDKARPPLGRRLIAGVFVVHRRNLSRRWKITPRNVSYEGVCGVSPAKRPERTMQYSRPPSPASRAPTLFCVGHESLAVLGPVGAGLPAKSPERPAQYSRTPSPASRLLQVRGSHGPTPCANHCRSWLASEESRKAR